MAIQAMGLWVEPPGAFCGTSLGFCGTSWGFCGTFWGFCGTSCGLLWNLSGSLWNLLGPFVQPPGAFYDQRLREKSKENFSKAFGVLMLYILKVRDILSGLRFGLSLSGIRKEDSPVSLSSAASMASEVRDISGQRYPVRASLRSFPFRKKKRR